MNGYTTLLAFEDIRLVPINQKYISRRFILNNKYRDLKDIIQKTTCMIKIAPPIEMIIHVWCYADIDSYLKVILDGLEHVFDNDRFIHSLTVEKHCRKRGKPQSLIVQARSISECEVSYQNKLDSLEKGFKGL